VDEEGSAQLVVAVPARRLPTDDGKAKLMARVFIGVDPHKLSATIEVVDDRETVLATGRFAMLSVLRPARRYCLRRR